EVGLTRMATDDLTRGIVYGADGRTDEHPGRTPLRAAGVSAGKLDRGAGIGSLVDGGRGPVARGTDESSRPGRRARGRAPSTRSPVVRVRQVQEPGGQGTGDR